MNLNQYFQIKIVRKIIFKKAERWEELQRRKIKDCLVDGFMRNVKAPDISQ
jgi:hypothetical protein